MIEPYYTAYQRDQWIRLQAIKNVVSELHKKRNVFINCGLNEPARKVWDEITRTQKEHDELAQKMIDDRNAMTQSMVKVFLVANLAYAKAMEFEALVKELTGANETALSADTHNMVKVCEEIALGIDHGGTDAQAKAFGELIDKLEERFNESIEPVIDNIMGEFKTSRELKKLF